ncbi:MAG: CheR family methyltransferase [Hyphomicrobiaceae bacterium]
MHSYDALCAYLKRTSGLVLDRDKRYLVDSRLLPIVQREKLSGLPELVTILERGSQPSLAKEVVQAMTINETYFFRDKLPFETLRDNILPRIMKAKGSDRTLRIWSAACSTGQEPYSIAMLLAELKHKMAGWRVEILGTDLANHAIDKAQSGTYTQFEVQRGLPTPYLLRYFNQTGDSWHICDAIKSQVSFRHFNLLAEFSPLGRFDVIFCRNVLIYFNAAGKKDILNRMVRQLNPEGYIVLGAAEGLVGIDIDLAADPELRPFLTRASKQATAAAR